MHISLLLGNFDLFACACIHHVYKYMKKCMQIHNAFETSARHHSIQGSKKIQNSVPKLRDCTTLPVIIMILSTISNLIFFSIAYELAPPLQVKFNDQLRATATYVCETDQQNAMHLVEGERVYVQGMFLFLASVCRKIEK